MIARYLMLGERQYESNPCLIVCERQVFCFGSEFSSGFEVACVLIQVVGEVSVCRFNCFSH